VPCLVSWRACLAQMLLAIPFLPCREAVHHSVFLFVGPTWEALNHRGAITDRFLPNTLQPCPFLVDGSQVRKLKLRQTLLSHWMTIFHQFLLIQELKLHHVFQLDDDAPVSSTVVSLVSVLANDVMDGSRVGVDSSASTAFRPSCSPAELPSVSSELPLASGVSSA
jgi:hypothetical protein